MKIISVANQKGGVGKTTTSLALGEGLMEKGYRVLFMDVDSQCSMTKQFQAQIEGQSTMYDVLTGNGTIEESIQHMDRGDVIAGDEMLQEVGAILPPLKRHLALKSALSKAEIDYDYIIIDCPPALDTALLNALTVSDDVIVPVECEIMTLEGLVKFADTVQDVREMANPKIDIKGMLMIKYDERTRLSKQLIGQITAFEKYLKTKTFNTKIRESVRQKEAHALRESILDYAPDSTVAIDYMNFVEEYLGK